MYTDIANTLIYKALRFLMLFGMCCTHAVHMLYTCVHNRADGVYTASIDNKNSPVRLLGAVYTGIIKKPVRMFFCGGLFRALRSCRHGYPPTGTAVLIVSCVLYAVNLLLHLLRRAAQAALIRVLRPAGACVVCSSSGAVRRRTEANAAAFMEASSCCRR